MAKKEQFQLVTQQKTLSQQVTQLLSDRSLFGRYKNLDEYVSAHNQYIDPKDYQHFLSIIEKDMFNQALYVALLQYYIMDRSGDWEESGEQQVKVAFCRNLLGIPSEEPLTTEHASEFLAVVEKKLQAYEIANLTLDAAKKTLEQYHFQFMGKRISEKDWEKLGSYLRFFGSKKIIYITDSGISMKVIWGEGQISLFDEIPVIVMKKEIVRSPGFVLATVAYVNHVGVVIRDEALWNIFYQKWVPVLDQDPFTRSKIQSDPFWSISQGIKERALELYGVTDKESLKTTSKKAFFKDMRETIVFHEIGHQVANDYILEREEYAKAKAVSYYKEDDVFETMIEFLADFAPKLGNKYGAMYNMVKVSRTDKIRAERLFWIYFSDVWFYDTEDTFMFTYSDFMAMILLRYIRPDLSIDFEQIEADIAYTPDESSSEKPSLFERVVNLLKKDVIVIEDICKAATYDFSKPRKLAYARMVHTEILKEKDPTFNLDSKYDLISLWKHIFASTEFGSDMGKRLENYCLGQKAINLKKMMVLSGGKKNAQAYNYDHRKYIVDGLIARNVAPKTMPGYSA